MNLEFKIYDSNFSQHFLAPQIVQFAFSFHLSNALPGGIFTTVIHLQPVHCTLTETLLISFPTNLSVNPIIFLQQF